MAKPVITPLHIEWSPDWVRALDASTGQTAEGATLADVTNITNGHRQALVAVSRGNVFLKSTRLPKASGDDLRRILMVQMATLFPLPSDQLAFDFIQTADQTADGCLTVVAAMRAEDLRRLRADFKQAGILPLRILPAALASPSVASRAGFADALVAEPDRKGLALDVVQGGITRLSRIAPLAADSAVEAQRTLAAAGVGALPIVSVGAANVPGATPGLDTSLSLIESAPSFNFDLAEDRLIEEKKRVASRTRLAVLMLLAAILLVVVVWADRDDAEAKVKAGQGSNARRLIRQQSILTHEAESANKLGLIDGTLTQAFQSAQPLGDIASVVSDSLSKDAWLTGMILERGKALEVRGASKSAADVGKFVDALSASPRFRDVKLVFANSALIGKVPVVQFNVTATCVGNLPMPVPDKKTAARTAAAVATGSAK
ncbi:MAG TPA: PilN domain-containing protein [Capsulimonadaceae bacterium]|jgi:hypothetical protein